MTFPALDTPEFNELMRLTAKTHGASRFALFAVRRAPDDAIQVADGLDDGTSAILWWHTNESRRVHLHSSAETALLLANAGSDRYRLVWVDSPPSDEPASP
ncbi:MAG TPA: hypothetical protein VGF17_27035 [Phytomonospora sp.]